MDFEWLQSPIVPLQGSDACTSWDRRVGATSDASVAADGTLVRCFTPGTASSVTQPASVEVSLNGQQHTSDEARFDFFFPVVSAIYPLLGPTAMQVFTGTGFHDFGAERLARGKARFALSIWRRFSIHPCEAGGDRAAQRDLAAKRRLSAVEFAKIQQEALARTAESWGSHPRPHDDSEFQRRAPQGATNRSARGSGTISFDFSDQPNASALLALPRLPTVYLPHRPSYSRWAFGPLVRPR